MSDTWSRKQEPSLSMRFCIIDTKSSRVGVVHPPRDFWLTRHRNIQVCVDGEAKSKYEVSKLQDSWGGRLWNFCTGTSFWLIQRTKGNDRAEDIQAKAAKVKLYCLCLIGKDKLICKGTFQSVGRKAPASDIPWEATTLLNSRMSITFLDN